MPDFLLSPSEGDLREKFKDLAQFSPIPETRGADILFTTPFGLFGLQRKQVPHDFLKSARDGRIAREAALLRRLPFAQFVGDGKFRYYPDTTVAVPGVPKNAMGAYKFTRRQIWGIELAIRVVQGIDVVYFDDTDTLVDYIKYLKGYMSKENHRTIFSRPRATNPWGQKDRREEDLWVLQGFPGVGVATAEKILGAFSGVIPLRWVCSLEDLMSIPGIGRATAERLMNCLPASKWRTT